MWILGNLGWFCRIIASRTYEDHVPCLYSLLMCRTCWRIIIPAIKIQWRKSFCSRYLFIVKLVISFHPSRYQDLCLHRVRGLNSKATFVVSCHFYRSRWFLLCWDLGHWYLLLLQTYLGNPSLVLIDLMSFELDQMIHLKGRMRWKR